MSGQIEKLTALFKVGSIDFVFQIEGDKAIVAMPMEGESFELKIAEWLAVANIVHKLLGDTPQQPTICAPDSGIH